jgi:small subunit ribosomal protein S17
MSAPQQAAAPKKGRRQVKVGRVVSDKMQKTIVVAVESFRRHPIYKKNYRWTSRYKAHDEENSARIGDLVRIEESRPLSRDKRWRLVEIIEQSAGAPAVAEVAAADVPELIEPDTDAQDDAEQDDAEDEDE